MSESTVKFIVEVAVIIAALERRKFNRRNSEKFPIYGMCSIMLASIRYARDHSRFTGT